MQMVILQRILSRIHRNSFFRSVAVLAGSTAIGQIVAVASIPLVARLYGPNDLGKFGLFFTYINVAVLLASASYETAIVAAKTDEDAAYLTVLSLVLALISSISAPLGLIGLIHGGILGFSKLPLVAGLGVFVALPLASSFNTLRYWMVRTRHFNLIGSITVYQNIGRSIGQISLGLLPFGWIGLLLGEILGRSVGVSRLVDSSYAQLGSLLRPFQLHRIWQIGGEYINFPRYLFPSVIVNVLAANMAMPIIVYLHGEEAGGLFFMAQRILALPVALIGTSVADVFHSKVASCLKHQPNQIRNLLLKVASTLFLFGIFPTVLISMYGGSMFGLIAGPNWVSTGSLLMFMAPASLAGLCVSPLSRLVCVIDGQKWKLLYDFFVLLSQGIVLSLGITYDLSLIAVIALSSGLTILAYGLYFLILLRLAQQAESSSLN
jgi:lipopolysaccharide exporter